MPLAATWLMMALEGPFLTAIIARMIDPKINLAAYGVSFSFAILIEAPVIMMMSASTALVADRYSFLKLKRFAYSLNTLVTAGMIIFLIPGVFDFIVLGLVGLPSEVAKLTYYSTLIMIPWPAAIGYRRFYQGILIRHNLTRRVAYGTIIRLITMTISAVILYTWSDLSGAYVGASALTFGVIAESIASKLMVNKTLIKIRQKNDTERKISYREIAKFYYPLALTSILSLGVHPMVTFFIGQSRMSIESLAVLPVINALVFIFRSLGLSYQEAVIALLGENKLNFIKLRNFGLGAGAMVLTSMLLIAYTPLSVIWFKNISGLTEILTDFSIIPLRIICIIPTLTFLISFQRALLVFSRETNPITYATISEVVGIIVIMYISIHQFDLVGAVGATLALLLGRIAANLYLIPPTIKVAKLSQSV